MPVVRVYVPASAWRELEQRGDPAALVRAMVAGQLGKPGTPEPRNPTAPELRTPASSGGRAHRKLHRPAVECPGRTFVNGTCTDCGAPE